MWISPSPRRRGTLSFPGPQLLLIAAGLSGCANPGPPKPPSLNLPAPAKDLRAERIGDQVHLAWTTSSDTTDDVATKPPLSAEVCRDLAPPALPAACTVVQRLPARPGPATAVDTLPPSLLTDPVRVLRYRVRLLNAAGHAADPSNAAFAAAGSAPAAVTGLRSQTASGGIRLLWQPEPSPQADVHLQRSTTTSLPAQVPPAAAPPTPNRKAPPASVHLLATSAGDSGGTIDRSGTRGVTYRYVAWRTRSVILNGKVLSLRSEESAPLLVTIEDRTPPASPAGLEAVADAASVDLSWEPDTDADLAGYWVERERDPGPGDAPASWQRLNQALLSAPAFRDRPPNGLSLVRYRVLAVDLTGNLSQPTPAVTVRLPTNPTP